MKPSNATNALEAVEVRSLDDRATCAQGGEDGSSPPVVATGLLQHEAKLTVLNFGVKKASSYNETLPSKTQLLLVTGVR